MIAAFLSAFVLSLLLNWIVRAAARRGGWVAGPRSKRHIHEDPVPRLGGIGVFLSFALVTAATELFRPDWFNQAGFLRLLIPASIIFGVGIYDDFRPVSAKIKLLVQCVCGTALFFWLRLTSLGLSIREIDFGEAILFVGTIVWVVLVSNSINLIDGVDGLAGGTAVLTLAAITCLAWRASHNEVALLAVILIGSLMGFLRFNLNPATMFLGDGGSLFSGFMISVLGVIWGDSRTIASTLGIAVAILALPLAETGVSVFRRFLSGRPLFFPDREHMHHKLLDRGLSQRQAVLVLYTMVLICGLSGFAIAIGGPYVFAISFTILILILTVGVSSLGYVEFLEIGRVLKRIFEQRIVMANDVELRKIAKRVQSTPCIAEMTDDLGVSLSVMHFNGLELQISPALRQRIHCGALAAERKWGFTGETKGHDVGWTMEFELESEKHGFLGRLRLSSDVDHSRLLFDANLLVTELQPAVVVALENCLRSQCSEAGAWRPLDWIAIAVDQRSPVLPQGQLPNGEDGRRSRKPFSNSKAND